MQSAKETPRQGLESGSGAGTPSTQRLRAPRGHAPSWEALAGAVVGAAIIAGVGGFLLGRSSIPDPPDAQTQQSSTVADGQDPQVAGCVPDAVAIAAETVAGVGTVKLIYSTRCDAFWAKIERVDGKAVGNKLEVTVVQRDDPDRFQEAEEPDTTSAYTFLLVRQDPTTRFCASGSVWIDGVAKPIPGPVC